MNQILDLLDLASDRKGWTGELSDADVIYYDDDPVRQWERRVRMSEAAALGVIALLLARRDEEVWEAWKAYAAGAGAGPAFTGEEPGAA